MLTQEQKALRRKGVGASEVAAVLGLSHWQTPLMVYLDKIGQGAPEDPDAIGPAWFGHQLEPVIVAAYQKRHPDVKLVAVDTVPHPALPWALATLDRKVLPKDGGTFYPLECKSRVWRTAGEFGKASEQGTDIVPDDVMCQAQWQMFVTETDRCDVAVLIDGSDYREFTVWRNNKLIDSIYEEVRAFWFGNVVARVEPPPLAMDNRERTLERLFPKQTGAMVETLTEDEEDLLHRFVAAKRVLKQCGDEVDLRAAQVKAWLGDREGVKLPEVGLSITWRNNKDSEVVDWKGLALELKPAPALIKQHTTIKPGPRVFRPTIKGMPND